MWKIQIRTTGSKLKLILKVAYYEWSWHVKLQSVYLTGTDLPCLFKRSRRATTDHWIPTNTPTSFYTEPLTDVHRRQLDFKSKFKYGFICDSVKTTSMYHPCVKALDIIKWAHTTSVQETSFTINFKSIKLNHPSYQRWTTHTHKF